jgi:hypothetical protein
MKEIEEDPHKWREIQSEFGSEDIAYKLYKLVHTFTEILTKNSGRFFDTDKCVVKSARIFVVKFVQIATSPRVVKTVLKSRKKIIAITLLNT